MSNTHSVTVRTALGELRGTLEGGVASFRGVPYAAPPLGALRFALPQPHEPWNGVRDATRHGQIAPQPPSRLRIAMGDFERPQSEDCLTLTIAAPAPFGEGDRRPVIVWLHGGAFLSGAGSLDWYDGSALARDGAIVVGVNYRLGPLGFLYCDGIAEGDMGLRDMAAAFAWVRENIAAFGGDPVNVTAMGQSAGAHAIMCLLATGEARGLFRRAILQSPPPSLAPLSTTAADGRGRRFLELLGIDPAAPDAKERLRAEDAARLATVQMALAREIAQFAEVAPAFVPVIDGLQTEAAFIDAAADVTARSRTSIIVGTTREEMHAFFAPDPAMENPDPGAVAERFATLAGSEDAIEEYRRRRPGARTIDLLGDLVTDYRFRLPSLRLAETIAARGGKAWAYQFDWAPPVSPFRACHCIELPFTFGSFSAWNAPMLEGGDPGAMAALSATMRAAWIGFARHGTPDLSGLRWPEYRSDRRWTMLYGDVIGAVGDAAWIALRDGGVAA